jgi:nucleotide-binding universal stress UspA family protein
MAEMHQIRVRHACLEGKLSLVNLRQAFRQPAAEKVTTPYRLVVYVTGSSDDQRVLEIVEKIGQRQNTHITIAYVVEVQQSMPLDAELPAEIERGEQVLRDAETFATRCVGGKRENVRTELLQARSAGAAIVDEAIDINANAIMLACSIRKKHGRSDVSEAVDYVLRNAPCEVLVIRRALPSWNPTELEQQ